MSTKQYRAGAAIRGRWIDAPLVAFGGRSTGISFLAPDPQTLVDALPLTTPDALSDLYRLSFDDILDYLDRLGERLQLEHNPHLQEALEASCLTSPLTEPVLRSAYHALPAIFSRRMVREIAENTVGIAQLEGWTEKRLDDGRRLLVRPFGCRALHIIAGNSPVVAGLTIMRNAIVRGDAIIKSPSNDPFTALAIARTMIEMDPDHPLTRHLSVAYWKGGDEAFESKLYRPQNLEKIIAWGGFASIKYVTRYIQPGLELISLDPKHSVSIIGAEAFDNEATLREVAQRLATDMGAVNQEGCACARVVYVLSGTDDAGIQRLRTLAQLTYAALQQLPQNVSTVCREMDAELRSCINAARLSEDWYTVVGGERDEGAVIVSHLPRPVDFATRLAKRVANLVPVDELGEVCAAVDSSTQTVGVYPESLKPVLRDRLSLHGAQRFTSLGYAANPTFAGPQDALESVRQMCRWVVCEDCDPAVTPPLWEDGRLFRQRAA